MVKKYLLIIIVSVYSGLYAQIDPDTTIQKNLKAFYSWYIAKANTLQDADFTPMVEKGDKGFAKLRIDKYCNAIKNSGYFTEAFMFSEEARLQPCAYKIAKIKYTRYQKFEVGELPDECNLFYYDRWFNAQDSPLRINIKSVKKLNAIEAEIKFAFDVGDGKTPNEWDIKCTAMMKFVGGEFKIDSISFE